MNPTLAFLGALGRSCRLAFAPDPRPNIVVFLANDARWGDYGFSGNFLTP
jgi:hypothetical protein